MHEGHQDIAADALRRPRADGPDHHGHGHAPGAAVKPGGRAPQEVTLRMPFWLTALTTTYRPFHLPALLILLALASWQGGINELVGIDQAAAILAVALGLAVIGRQTLQEVLRARRITAGVLVTIALVATVVVEHYIAGAVVAIMMLLGEALESLTLARTRDAIGKLMDLTPPLARVKHGDHFHEVPVERVKVGDVVAVFAGERLPVDGVVVEGHSALDQSPITGESLPVDKAPGERVFSGTMNLSGPIELRATAVGENSTVGKIIAVVREAQARKGPAQKVADRFAGWFTPLVLAVASVTLLFSGDILRAVAVLVIACPCALVLATPTAVVASVGNAARRGALIKGGVTLEKLAGLDTIVFDKTGTLTLGQPRVASVKSFRGRRAEEVLALAATLEHSSRHPLAQAIAAAVPAGSIGTATAVKELPGRGMTGSVSGAPVVVGTARLLEENGIATGEEHRQAAREHEANGWTGVWVAEAGQVVGLIALGDTIRPGATQMLQEVKGLGIRETVLLTGDNRGAAEHVARELGVGRVFSGVLPTEKSDVIAGLQKEGRRVAMVGDGINDGPALAVSDVGIAMGAAGSDIAIDTADIALLGDRLEAIPAVLRLGRRTYSVIQQNIYLFALLANIGGMGLASAGILTPIMAAIVHNVSSVFVVVNSARLLGAR
jgi:Cd2+/Zn2+-exporting ATPase